MALEFQIISEFGKIGQIDDILVIDSNNGDKMRVYVRHGAHLSAFNVSITAKREIIWKRIGHQQIFNQLNKSFPTRTYPWYVTDTMLDDDSDGIIIRNEVGFGFYRFDPRESSETFQLLSRDDSFHDLYRWNEANVLIGRFYADTHLIGVLSRKKTGVMFYSVNKEELMTGTPDPLYPLHESYLNQEIVTRISDAIDLYLADIQRDGQDNIILLTKNHRLEMYKFDDNYDLQKVAELLLISVTLTERFFFVNLTGQSYLDVVRFNRHGLYVYQMKDHNYTLVHYHAGFSETNGWNPNYEIRLVDINHDGRDDLIFTGPKGLTVLGFHPETLKWESFLDPADISTRFATVVATVTSVTESILLTTDQENKLYMGRLLIKNNPPPEMISEPIPPVKRKQESRDVKIPSQIKRIVTEKPILRWTEQWANPLTDFIDHVSGSLDFSLPIFQSFAVPHQISLSYQSQLNSLSNIVGSGWSISLPDTYILVNYHGTIFLEDATFYLAIGGGLLQLRFYKINDGVRLFREPFQSNWNVEYREKEQRWIIDTETDIYIFGSNNKMEVIRWNLNWPRLQLIPVAWYLIERQLKASNQSIIYEYEIDSVDYKSTKWTAAIRLTKIESSTTLTFDYALKEEYQLSENQNNSTIFPVPLRESHYLTSCRIVTKHYSQQLEFKYNKINGKRLLIAIEQPITADIRESIFHFSYEATKLNEIKFPNGLKVKFRYDTIPDIEIPDPYSTVAHPVEEQPAMDYNHDYVVMVFKQRQVPDQIQVKILGVDWLETLVELSPVAGTTEGKIVSYNVQSYSDFIYVLLKTDKKLQKMCLYHRHIQEGKRKWNRDPTCHWFNDDALLIRSSEAGVAIAGNSGVVQIFQLTDQSKWIQHRLSAETVVHFEMLGHLIVGYDDHHIFFCHPDGTNQWQMGILEILPGLFSDGAAIVKKFQFRPENEKILLENLKRNVVQLSGNSIAVSSLHLDDDHQLSLKIRLFLLNSNYTNYKRREFKVQVKNVLELRSEINSNGTRCQLGYRVTEDGSYQVKLFNLSGNDVDIILSNIKRNQINEFQKLENEFETYDDKIQEEFEWKQLKQLKEKREKEISELEMEWTENGIDSNSQLNGTLEILYDFEKLLAGRLLFDWSAYQTRIVPEGLLVGTDTFIRLKDDDWEKEIIKTNNKKMSIPLGESFVLIDESDGNSMTLYAKDSNTPLPRLLEINPPIVNRYPAYLAYQNGINTKVILFKNDGKTLGNVLTFPNEQLVSEISSYERLTTLAPSKTASEKLELLTRSLRSINPVGGKRSAVHEIQMSNNDVTRSTGYQWDNNTKGNVTITIVPGNDRKMAGWLKETWTPETVPYSGGWIRKTLEMFDADGQLVHGPPEKSKESDDPSKESILWDSNKRRIISDFSPYKINDQMVSYYGFESYETNNSSWRFVDSTVMDEGFSLTGSNFLRLNTKRSLLEGTFTPVNQQTIYVASCWIRPSEGSLESTMEEDLEITAHLKAIVKVNGEEIAGLLGRIMPKAGGWFYVEVLIDFDIIKRLFESRFGDTQQDPQFTITIKMEAQQNTKAVGVDVDHVRFSPLAHDFKATVYDHERPVSVISSSGSISRTVYYRGREMAVITDGQLEQVMTSSYTGRLVPQGSTASPPCRIVFYPDNGGLFETFDAYSFSKRWNDPAGAWMIASGRLWHNHQQSNRIISVDPSVLFGEESSAVVRCYYSLQSSTASMTWKWNNGHVKLTRKSTESFSSLNVTFKDKSIKSVIHLPNSAELIIMTEGERFFIWIDSVLLLDLVISTANWSSFAFEAQGNSYVEDCVFMGNPRTEIEYMDDWGEKMQTIQLESDKSVLVKQILYDSLGRPAIETKLTRVTVDNKRKSLLTYHSNFISGSINPADPHSVWKSHRLQGEVDRLNPLDGGVPYFRTEYEANPLNEKQINGQPGPDFAVNGTYAMKFRTNIKKDKINVISNHFPTRQGFRYKMEEKPNGTKKVAVFDRHNNNRVALYVYVPGYDHLLSTYEYDSQNRLIKILPPLYHERVHTFGKSNLNLTEEMDLQKSLGTFMSYDETGRLIRKTTPDTGCVEYYYNRQDQIRLQVHSTSEESDEIDSVVYYEYDDKGIVSRTGFLEQMPISRQQFEKSLNEGSLSNAKDYQLIDRTEMEERHYDPSLSGGERNATFVIHNDDYIVIEDMRWDSQDRLLESRRVGSADSEVRKTFYPHSNRLKSIQYPGMKLEHYYNKLGQLIGLKLNGTSEDLVGFSYGGSGQLDVEYHRGFNRTFKYNSPGYLEQISDPYLTEWISYTVEGYGQNGSGDGIVMRTTFKANWPPNSDWRWFQVTDNKSIPESCLKALKRIGLMTQTGRPIKDYYPTAMDEKNQNWMPLVCGGRNGQRISKWLAQKRMPGTYGHRYAYGNHQELVKAKYFTEETEKLAVPFQPDTLADQTVVNKPKSRDIWKQLNSAGFILTDQRKADWLTAVANRGIQSLVRRNELNSLLQASSTSKNDVTLYQDQIEMMILNDIGHRRDNLPKLDEFQKIFLQWKGVDDGSAEQFRRAAEKIHKDLSRKMKKNTNWLDVKLLAIFRPYSKHLADFIRIINQHFTYGLGEHPFDVASYDIDANGNHQKFTVGFNIYKFTYRSNQIQSVKIEELGKLDNDDPDDKEMDHDSHGNVIKALHKGIERIEYNGASMRTSSIHLTDGSKIQFAYDAQGERILKRVFTKDDQLVKEIQYVRDEDGRVLFDRRSTFSPEDFPLVIVATVYIYGPRGLVGFIRNGAFHSVWTDHSGSIRLVLKDGQVVAAYDYLPYGQLMRSYGNDPASQIFYRYTGQEWDQETGLYNYHARLYDPEIGRFYQPDPREQYFSPYKYVGNSPVSLIDPDGEFGLLITILSVMIGAYLGGATANNKWNPVQWDYKSENTWLGITGGAITGFFIPSFAVASAAQFGISFTAVAALSGAYVSTAASNKDFNPVNWNWTTPSTYNGIFEGISTGLGIWGGLGMATKFAQKLGTIGKISIATTTVSTAIGFAYGKGVAANGKQWDPSKWDWTSPVTYNALLEGFDTGIGLPTDVANIGRGIYKLVKKNPKQWVKLLSVMDNVKMKKFKPVLASVAKGPAGKTATGILIGYLMASKENEDFDPKRWDSTSFNTYETFLNGLFLGIGARKMLKTPLRKLGNVGDKLKKSFKSKVSAAPAMRQAFDNTWKRMFRNAGIIRQQNHLELTELETTSLSRLHTDEYGLQYSANKDHRSVNNQDLKMEANQLTAIENANHRKRKRRDQIFTDDDVTLFSCVPVKRRRKREPRLKRPATCFVANPDNQMQKNMKEDPVGVLKQVAISTKSITDWPDFKKYENLLVNGGISPFQLIPASKDSSYHLKVGSSQNDPSTVPGYWLNTGGEIKIDPFGKARFIFTSELQGCSIYIKYNHDAVGKNGKHEPTMSLYHQNRRFPDAIYLENGGYTHNGKEIPELNGVTQLFDSQGNILKPDKDAIIPMGKIFYKKDGNMIEVEKLNGIEMDKMITKNLEIKKTEDDLNSKYDQVIRYEDYLGFPGNYNNKMAELNQPVTFATPVIYRDDNGQWHFSSQKISYMDGLVDKENFQIHSKLGNDLFIQNSNKKRKIKEILYLHQIGPGTSNKFASDVFTEPLISIPRSRDDSLAKDFKEESSRKVITAKRTNRISVSDFDIETSSTTIRKRPVRSVKWIDRILISLSPEEPTQKSLELSSNRSFDYRDVSIENCHSISADAIVCYGSRGKTTVFTSKVNRDTYNHCRPIEWHGQPSVTCQGEQTTFIHTPYNRNSTATHLFNAVDGWLILAQATPGIYRELMKFAGHVKNVWNGSTNQINVAISDKDKESWRNQLTQLEQLVAKQQQQFNWALPLIDELRQQISSFDGKTQTETMDDVRAVKTMTERLSALMEDVQEQDQIFHDCLEEFPDVDDPELTSAESLSIRLHHLNFF